MRPRELARSIAALRADLTAGIWTEASRETAARLYADLVFPARVEGDRLVVVPDEELHSLPFAALINPSTRRYLVEEREVVVAPSATVYLAAHDRFQELRKTPALSAVVVGDPVLDRMLFPGLAPLAGARDEARRVAALYPRRALLLGNAATRSALLEAVDGRDVLHFAGHAAVNRMAPERSSLPLAAGGAVEDAALSALDIAALRLDLDSHRGALGVRQRVGTAASGEGPLSLARAFLSAGAPTVVASLWPVPDGPTAPLITSLHQRLRAGDEPAAALRAAQLALLRSQQPSLRSPAVWSVFEAFGG